MNERSEWLANSLCFVRHSGVAWFLIPQIVHGGCELDWPIGVRLLLLLFLFLVLLLLVVSLEGCLESEDRVLLQQETMKP